MKTISLTTAINGTVIYINSTKNFRIIDPTNLYVINNEVITAIATQL